MTGYWDPDRERRRKTEFHEMLRQRTVGEQMQELPERVKKFFGEWVRGGHQGKYLRGDGRMILQEYLESKKRIGIVAYEYDAFKAILRQELDSYKVDFLCHLLMANDKGQDFGGAGVAQTLRRETAHTHVYREVELLNLVVREYRQRLVERHGEPTAREGGPAQPTWRRHEVQGKPDVVDVHGELRRKAARHRHVHHQLQLVGAWDPKAR